MAQLKKLKRNIEIREKNFQIQHEFFDKHNKFFSNPIQTANTSTAWLAYPVLINEEASFSRKEFQIFLEKRNIQTRVVFTGNILRQPMMKGYKFKVNSEGYPNSDAVMQRGVLLPIHHGMKDNMFERLHETIEEFIKNR